ncbi:MAG: formylmethanofuran dehydrogenase subunit C [Thermovirgaceae bacterium]
MTEKSQTKYLPAEETPSEAVFLEYLLKEPLPVEAPALTPDNILGKSEKEIGKIPVLAGNRWQPLGEVFKVTRRGDEALVISGDLKHVKRIGEKMRGGLLVLKGSPGMHLGESMGNGKILVEGDLPDWCCCNMQGGLVMVRGGAGNMLAAALPGETRGMRGGVVIVEGDTGIRTGEAMRRGLIAVGGATGEFAGARMVAGTLAVFGRIARRAGGGMKRGTIMAIGGVDELLPSFRRSCSFRSPFIEIYLKKLQSLGLPVGKALSGGFFARWLGDVTSSVGKGEILVYEGA